MGRILVTATFFSTVLSSNLTAQASGLPTFNAPYRNFENHEAGFTVTFPDFDNTAIEGMYRFGLGQFDIGFRGGFWFVNRPARRNNDQVLVLGVEARHRVVTHSVDFPADGALILGVGGQFGAVDDFLVTGGVSFGRRLEVEDSDVVIVPFVQPTGWLAFGDTDEFQFGIGLGGDFQLSPRFDLRLSLGVGDRDGFAISGVWIR